MEKHQEGIKTSVPAYELKKPGEALPASRALLHQYLLAEEQSGTANYRLLLTEYDCVEVVYVEGPSGRGKAYIGEDYGYSVSLGPSLTEAVDNYLTCRGQSGYYDEDDASETLEEEC